MAPENSAARRMGVSKAAAAGGPRQTKTRQAASLSGCFPGNWQVEQSTECPTADPAGIAFDEAELLQTPKDRRERDVGNHRAGSPGSCAEMWTSAKSDALAGIPANVELFRALKVLLIAVARAEHQKHPLLRFEFDIANGPRLGNAARGHSDRRYP